MSQNTKENKNPEVASYLGTKPQRQTGKKIHPLPIAIGVVVLIIIIGAFVLLRSNMLSSQTATSSNTITPASGATTVSNGSKQPAGCTSDRLPNSVVLDETAKGLHMTVSAIQSEVNAGKTIAQIATAQKIPATQLHTIEVNALQTANNQWLQKGCITSSDVKDNMQRDTGSADYMDTEFTGRFKNP